MPIATVGALSLSAGVLGTSGTLPSSVTGSLAVLGTLTSTTGNITLAAAQYVVEGRLHHSHGHAELAAEHESRHGRRRAVSSSLMKATAINVTGTGTSGNNLLTINSTIPPAQIIRLVQDPNFTTDPTGLPSIINSTPAVASANLTTVDLARHTIAGLTARQSGPIISYQNVQNLAELVGDNSGADLTTNHLKISGSSGSDRAIVDNLTFAGNLTFDSSGFPSGGNFGLAAGTSPKGTQTPVAGSLQELSHRQHWQRGNRRRAGGDDWRITRMPMLLLEGGPGTTCSSAATART